MSKILFNKLFKYSFEMNNNVIDKMLAQQDKLSIKTIELMCHILNAHQIWNARINNTKCFDTWQRHALDKLYSLNKKNFKDSMNILELKKMDTIIQYTNTAGQIYSNSIEDIMLHIINHSTYHRAQIATEMKQSDIIPVVTDYIVYTR